jgi:hypothetical protein
LTVQALVDPLLGEQFGLQPQRVNIGVVVDRSQYAQIHYGERILDPADDRMLVVRSNGDADGPPPIVRGGVTGLPERQSGIH